LQAQMRREVDIITVQALLSKTWYRFRAGARRIRISFRVEILNVDRHNGDA